MFELVDMTADKRFIYENNGVRFVYAKEGETPESMAKEFGVKYKRFANTTCCVVPTRWCSTAAMWCISPS